MARPPEQHRRDGLIGNDVIHQEDAGARKHRQRQGVPRAAVIRRTGVRRRDGQAQPERIARSLERVAPDFASNERHQPAADRQPEPAAGLGLAARMFKPGEGLEQALAVGFGDPRAGIGHGDVQAPVGLVALEASTEPHLAGIGEFHCVA